MRTDSLYRRLQLDNLDNSVILRVGQCACGQEDPPHWRIPTTRQTGIELKCIETTTTTTKDRSSVFEEKKLWGPH